MSKMALKRGTGRKLLALLVVLVGSYSGWVVLWARQGSSLQEVAVGRSSCHLCGMVVSDLRHAVSVLDKDAEGHPVTRHFDDVGCFLTFARKHRRGAWEGIAHNYATGKPVPLTEAHFARPGVSTPMGSGWVAQGGPNESD